MEEKQIMFLLERLISINKRTQEIILKIACTIPELKNLEETYKIEDRERWENELFKHQFRTH